MTDDKIIDIKSKVKDRVASEAEALKEKQKPKDKEETITPEFIAQCLYANQLGDGRLYAALHKDKFIFVKSWLQWLEWSGNSWRIDKLDKAHINIEAVALIYQNEGHRLNKKIAEIWQEIAELNSKAKALKATGDEAAANDMQKEINKKEDEVAKLPKQRDALYRRAQRLRGNGAAPCLDWAHKNENALAIIGDEIDKKPMLLPCANSVIDLKTGNITAGKPSDYLMRSIPVEYAGLDMQCPLWEKFILEIIGYDEPTATFIQRLLGYALTGLTNEHYIIVCTGEGRNGKGTLFELLMDIMGELAWAIQPEMILEQRNPRSSSGPTPDIMSLAGKRIIVASETSEHQRISAEKIKKLTGGDRLTGRASFDKYDTNFEPTHTLFLQTNHVPRGLTKDFALLQRLICIHFPYMFVDDPEEMGRRNPQLSHLYKLKDKNMKDKLKKEIPGILSWLVRGCLDWQKQGLKQSSLTQSYIETLRDKEDIVGAWLASHVVKADIKDFIPFKELYESFIKWYQENEDDKDKNKPSRRRVSEWIEKKGFKKENKRGAIVFYGLRLLAEYEIQAEDTQSGVAFSAEQNQKGTGKDLF